MSHFRSEILSIVRVSLVLSAAAAAFGCSSDSNEPAPATGGGSSTPSTGGSGTGGSGTGGSPGSNGGSTSATGGAPSDPNAVVGTFTVTLSSANELNDSYTSVIGKVYSGAYPSDIIETPLATGNGCTTYKFSRQSCIDVTCTGSQVCAAPEECRDVPRLVSVGKVSVMGIDPGTLMLSGVNNNYQYPADIAFPGFSEGAMISLSATGDFYPAFEVTTTGVAPVVMKADSYLLAPGKPLALEWEAGGNADAQVSVVLNISKHGGSAGYLRCDTTDSRLADHTRGCAAGADRSRRRGLPGPGLHAPNARRSAGNGREDRVRCGGGGCPAARRRRLLLVLRQLRLRLVLRLDEDGLRLGS